MSDLENLVHNAFAEMQYPNAAAALAELKLSRQQWEETATLYAHNSADKDATIAQLRKDLEDAKRHLKNVLNLVSTQTDPNEISHWDYWKFLSFHTNLSGSQGFEKANLTAAWNVQQKGYEMTIFGMCWLAFLGIGVIWVISDDMCEWKK